MMLFHSSNNRHAAMMLSRWRRCTIHGDSEILVGEVPLLSPMRMFKTKKRRTPYRPLQMSAETLYENMKS